VKEFRKCHVTVNKCAQFCRTFTPVPQASHRLEVCLYRRVPGIRHHLDRHSSDTTKKTLSNYYRKTVAIKTPKKERFEIPGSAAFVFDNSYCFDWPRRCSTHRRTDGGISDCRHPYVDVSPGDFLFTYVPRDGVWEE
jgi:hypothetical protein